MKEYLVNQRIISTLWKLKEPRLQMRAKQKHCSNILAAIRFSECWIIPGWAITLTTNKINTTIQMADLPHPSLSIAAPLVKNNNRIQTEIPIHILIHITLSIILMYKMKIQNTPLERDRRLTYGPTDWNKCPIDIRKQDYVFTEEWN